MKNAGFMQSAQFSAPGSEKVLFSLPGRAVRLKTRKKVLTRVKPGVMIIKRRGGIAQLGERLNGIQEVSGSIPLISTK